MPMISTEWGQCVVCGRVTWVYLVNGLTTRARCFQCWRDAVNVGLISEKIYEKIRARAKKSE
ncbi:hypothetical protein ES703_10644 [subsurface metagenome]